jgi:hypothetical protein
MFVLFSAEGNETPGRSLTSPRLKPSRGSKVVAEGYWETKNVFQAYT